MGTFLVEYSWLPRAVLLVLVLVGPPMGAWFARRPRLAAGAAVLATTPVLGLTLLPDDRVAFETCEMSWTISLRGAEPVANIVLFVVPALMAVTACRRPLVVLLAAVTLSVLIEVVQAAAPMLGRSCSTGDVIANGFGALTGVLLGVIALWLADRRRRRDDQSMGFSNPVSTS